MPPRNTKKAQSNSIESILLLRTNCAKAAAAEQVDDLIITARLRRQSNRAHGVAIYLQLRRLYPGKSILVNIVYNTEMFP